MNITKTFKITIVGSEEEIKEKYKFIRDSQYAQNRALNIATSYLGGLYLEYRDFNNDEYKEKKMSFKYNKDNMKFGGLEFGRGIDTLSSIKKVVDSSLKNTPLKEIARGERILPSYKRDNPLLTRGRHLKFYYEGKDIYIKWVNKIIFKVVIAGGRNNKDFIHMIHKIVNKEYEIGGSKILFDKNNKLILKLSINIPDKEKVDFIKGRTLGVDVGVAYPAYVSINDEPYKRMSIGNKFELIKYREQFRNRRQRVQQQCSNAKGGKGRKHKLQAMETLKNKESNFAKTYNHNISKRVVAFAKENKCQFINLERIDSNGIGDKLLGQWGYYELQQMIKYKAEIEGIEVRYIDPAYTSQTCSNCGNVDKENRKSQDKFVCTSCGFGEKHGFKIKDERGNKKIYVNADHNAAINIARSENFLQ